MPRPIVAPTVAADERLTAFALGETPLQDELELAGALVSGAASGVAARNLELSA